MLATLASAGSLWSSVTWGDIAAFLIRLTVVAATGYVILAAMPRASAALRHQIVLATLVALLALPFAAAFLPELPIPVLPSRTLAVGETSQSSPEARQLNSMPSTSDVRVGRPSRLAIDESYALGVDRSGSGDALPRPSFPIANAAPLALLAALVGTAMAVARWLMSMFAASRIARDAEDVIDAGLRVEFEQAMNRLGLRRGVALRETHLMAVPIVWGVFRPVLLLPAGAQAWSRERRRIVLLHELAHIARHDGVALLVARTVTAVFWFHPLVWALARSARRDCEHACDDVVLASGERASSYAEHLLAIARSAWSSDALGDIAPAFARHSKLEHRLVAILSPNARRDPATRRTLAAIAIATLLIALPVATARVVAAPTAAPAPVPEATIEFAGSSHGEELFDIAGDRYGAERYGAAAEAYIRAAAAGYRIGTALYNAACSFALDNQPDKAIDALEQALEAGFDSPELITSDDDLDSIRSDPRFQRLAGKARATDRGQQQKVAAIRKYDVLRASRSNDAGEWKSIGIRLMRLDEFARAIDAFEAEFAINSSSSALYNTACAMALSGDRKQALDMLERAILAGSGNHGHILNDADLRSLRREPRFRDLLELARDLELEGDLSALGSPWGWRTSIPRYERIAQERPTVGRAWSNLGFAQLRGDDPESAAESYRKAIELNYRKPTSMYNLACAYAQMRQPDEAVHWLERAEAAGMEVGNLALGDDDLDPVRSDRRFQRMSDRWEREMKSARNEKRHD